MQIVANFNTLEMICNLNFVACLLMGQNSFSIRALVDLYFSPSLIVLIHETPTTKHISQYKGESSNPGVISMHL